MTDLDVTDTEAAIELGPIATGSYRRFQPDWGVGVGISVGRPRRPIPGVLGRCRVLEPHGIFPKFNDDRPEYERRYRLRVANEWDAMIANLAEVRRANADVIGPLVLLCWDDLDEPDMWCHRELAAELLEHRLGITIPDLG